MKTIIYFISLLTLMTCVKEKHIVNRQLKEDKLVSEFFNDKEIEELGKIILFFESQICLDKSLPKEKCYYNFSQDRINEVLEIYKSKNKKFTIPINYKEQKKYYSKLDKIFFKEIWVHPVIGYGREKPKKRDWYVLNLFGKFSKFIKDSGDKNNDFLFQNFYENFNITNHITFLQQGHDIKKLSVKDYKDIKKRLFFSVYYLSLKEISMNSYSPKK